MDCQPFPNTRIFASARKIGRGAMAGCYLGRVETSEVNGWGKAYISRFTSQCFRTSRADALADATRAMNEAALSGYVPPF
jgi:hypothetical protein